MIKEELAVALDYVSFQKSSEHLNPGAPAVWNYRSKGYARLIEKSLKLSPNDNSRAFRVSIDNYCCKCHPSRVRNRDRFIIVQKLEDSL